MGFHCMGNQGFYQQNSVINYANIENPYTRCVEYKHFLNQKSDYTIYSKEMIEKKVMPHNLFDYENIYNRNILDFDINNYNFI
jgi:UDP-galactopyranose mutase